MVQKLFKKGGVMFEIKESSLNRCKTTVALVSGRFCMNRLLERVIICEGHEKGIAMAIWAQYEDDSNEYGSGIAKKHDYRMPDEIPKELKYHIKKYLDEEIYREEENNEISDLRQIRNYLKKSISKIDYKIEDNIRRKSYSEGFDHGRKPESNRDDFLASL